MQGHPERIETVFLHLYGRFAFAMDYAKDAGRLFYMIIEKTALANLQYINLLKIRKSS